MAALMGGKIDPVNIAHGRSAEGGTEIELSMQAKYSVSLSQGPHRACLEMGPHSCVS